MSTSDRSLSRATLAASVIGGICVIIAAWIGVSVGQRSAGEDIGDLKEDVTEREKNLRSLEEELERRDAQVRELRNSLVEQANVIARLEKDIARLGLETPASDGASAELPTRSSLSDPGNAPPKAIWRETGGDFVFELRGCSRHGEEVRCALTITNTANSQKGTNLCGSYLIDTAGRRPPTQLRFDGGLCGAGLESNLPVAFVMSAVFPRDSTTLNAVLADGNHFSFPGSVIFRDITIGGDA